MASVGKWPEIEEAQKKQKRDIKIAGDSIAKRVEESKGVLDPQLWTLVGLTKLEIIGIPSFEEVPADIAQLKSLKEVTISNTKLSRLSVKMSELPELKILIMSNNQLTSFPKELCVGLSKCLQVLNVSQNKITSFPPEIGQMTELITLNASLNQIKVLPVQLCKLHRLSTLNVCHNVIESLNGIDFSNMPALLTLDLSHNKFVETPGEVGLCSKLRDLNLSDNPFKDKKLTKMVETGKVKNILQHLQKSAPSKKKDKEEEEEEVPLRIRIDNPEDLVRVIIGPSQTQRPFIVMTVVKGFHFTEESFKQFIDLQTEIHQGMCKKRTIATIGTHDMKSCKSPIMYGTRTPEKICFVPLKLEKPLTGLELAKHFEDIKDENMLKYLSLIRSNQVWPILYDATGEIISLPPVINSKYSQITVDTTDILLEVTAPSTSSLQMCKDVMATLLKRMVQMIPLDQQLVVEQVKVQGENGHVRIQYPSQKDLEEICA